MEQNHSRYDIARNDLSKEFQQTVSRVRLCGSRNIGRS